MVYWTQKTSLSALPHLVHAAGPYYVALDNWPDRHRSDLDANNLLAHERQSARVVRGPHADRDAPLLALPHLVHAARPHVVALDHLCKRIKFNKLITLTISISIKFEKHF